jgi:hypothetical protein
MDSWREMAATLPDHHVLAVEMYRVSRNETVAVFTLVKKGKVVQEVLRGDGRGLNVRPEIRQRDAQYGSVDMGRKLQVEALMIADAADGDGDGDVNPSMIAIGSPPPQQPADPGIIAVGGVGLQNSFDTGEIVTAGS